MSLTIRQLLPAEYARLDGHQALEGVTTAPRTADYFIAEDASTGTIHAVWTLLPVVHTEPVWISPPYRSTLLGSRLWRAVRAYLDSSGLRTAYCFAGNSRIAGYLGRLGFTPLPYATFQYTCLLSPKPLPPSSDSD